MTETVIPTVGDRVRIVQKREMAMLGGVEGEIIAFLDDGVHVRVDAYKETAWLGGRDYLVQAEDLCWLESGA